MKIKTWDFTPEESSLFTRELFKKCGTCEEIRITEKDRKMFRATAWDYYSISPEIIAFYKGKIDSFYCKGTLVTIQEEEIPCL